jgi:methylase of polypeptide subunit release factors
MTIPFETQSSQMDLLRNVVAKKTKIIISNIPYICREAHEAVSKLFGLALQ